MTLGVGVALAEEQAKQRRPLAARRSQHLPSTFPAPSVLPATAQNVAVRFDGARDGPGTPDGVDPTARSKFRSGETRLLGYHLWDHRGAGVCSDPSSSLSRRVEPVDATPSPVAETNQRRGPGGAVHGFAENTLAHDGTPAGLRWVITSSCVAQENLSVVKNEKVRSDTNSLVENQPARAPTGEFPSTFENAEGVSPENVSHKVKRLLRAAQALLRGEGCRGRFADAQALIAEALFLSPSDADAACASGACYFGAGDLDKAFCRFAGALAINESHVPTLQALGLLYQTRGMLPEAVRVYSLAIEAHNSLQADAKGVKSFGVADAELSLTRTRLAATLSDVGTQIKLKGDVVKAMSHYTDAVQIDPKYAPAVYNLGVALHELGEHTQAEVRFLEASFLDQTHADALCNLGVVRKLRGDLNGAIAAYEQCLLVNPNHVLVNSNIAIALNDLANGVKATGDVSSAIRVYEKALTFDSVSADVLYNLGVANAEVGERDRAVINYELVLKIAPGCAEAWNNLGVLLRERGNVTRAVECYRRAVALKPEFARAWNNLGVLCTVLGHAREALGALQAAICADPSYAVAHNNAGVLFRDTGDIPEALASYKECARLNPDDRNASQNYLMSLNYVYDGRLPLVSDAHIQWGQRMMQSVGLPMRQRAFDAHRDVGAGEKLGNISQLLPLIRSNSRGGNPGRDTPPIALTPGNSWDDLAALTSRDKINPTQNSRPLVVGYVSPDMYTHSVSYFAAAPLAHHDRTRVKCVVYSATPVEDSRTKLLRAHVARAGGEWRDVSLLTERALAELIHSDGVDILVELSGHTANNKLATLALRPAPVQVTWAGYPNTTGLNGAVDYRITDEYCDPVDTRQVFAETNVRLPGCFLSYAPHPASPPVAPAPCVNAGYVTFGCFNALAKITKNVRALWGRLLKQTPNSRLVVKAKPFACVSIRDRFLAAMATEQGIASWRIDVRPLVASTETHLRTYAQIDIALDTFPYAGTTTTCEALFAGVPVVTLAGHSHAHNVGVSLLAAVDLEGRCVAKSENEYVAMCVALASDHSALGELRKGMRATMQKRNGLCDGAAFTTKLEHAYVAMWRRYCAEKGRA